MKEQTWNSRDKVEKGGVLLIARKARATIDCKEHSFVSIQAVLPNQCWTYRFLSELSSIWEPRRYLISR